MSATAERNPTHKLSTGQASPPGSDAARSVLVLGTTAPASKSLGNREWVADLEHVWRVRTEPELDRLKRRARTMRRYAASVLETWKREHADEKNDDEQWCGGLRVKALRSAEWADERARAVAMSRQDIVNSCDERWRSIACGCKRYDVRVGCDQPQLCVKCRKRHASKWWRRIATGMDNALRSERRAWHNTPSHRRRGMLPGIYLITLTAPHSDDMVKDRETIGAAVRKLLKHAQKHGWFRTYALTWEATGGVDSKGHVHVHLACVSSWIPYRRREVARDDVDAERWDSESPNARPRPPRIGKRRYATERGLHDVWQQAIPGAIQPDVSPPNRERNEAQSAGYYLAKYVTKGIEPAEFTGAKAGELLCAFRNRRKVSTSAHFWADVAPSCSECQQSYRLTESPCSLQDIAPDAVLRSHAVRHRWRLWSQDELFSPWETRAPDRPSVPRRERVNRMNRPTKWKLPP